MANKFWVGGSGTWDNSTTTHWSLSSGGAGGAAVPGSSDVAVFDSNSGASAVVTVDSTINGLTFSGITLTGTGGFAGTLDFSVNNPSITITGTFSITGTGTRTVNLGTGTFTFTLSNGTVWDATTTTGLSNPTTACASATFVSGGDITTSGSRSFTLGTLTYGTITINSPSTHPYQPNNLNGSPTIGTLNINGANFINMQSSQTLTIATLNVNGSSGNEVYLGGGSTNGPATTFSVASGAPTISWAAIHYMTFTGGATFIANNSFDLRGNTGITINAPSGGGGAVFGS